MSKIKPKEALMAVSKRLRYEILRRDQHTCRYCGAGAPEVPLRVDHVTPVALGGTDTPDNLVTSCEPCNSGKSSATVDSAVVANVSDDALRWADAIKQAADELRSQEEPKRAYRTAFEQAWNGWTWERNGKKETFTLPAGWKASLDSFHEAGLPQEVWADIVEKTMTNKSVSSENLFRYACGIGWRMVRELHDRAKAITGRMEQSSDSVDSVTRAAWDVWESEQADDVTPELRASFRESVASLVGSEEGHRIIFGAQQAAWCGEADVAGALQANDHNEAYHQWWCSWISTVGEYPSDERGARMREQIDALLAARVSRARIARAAVYAGSRHSALLHFGLDPEELKLVRVTDWFAQAMEIWRSAFYAAAGHWPGEEARSAFIDSLSCAASDDDIFIADIHAAAAAAGTYQDPEISTCLTRHLSVFEIASRPLEVAA
jgi:hypothetical protein